jgi:hypothetical protein
MTKTLILGPNRTISLPRSIFKTSDRVVVVSLKDTIMIKKLTPSPHLSSLAHRKKGKALSLREISKEVHQHRKEK